MHKKMFIIGTVLFMTTAAKVSVEYSNAYSEFKPGLYLVIVASGRRGEAPTRKALEKAKSVYLDAYAKVAGVYMGCMH